jgi:hypothetical protein
MTNDDAIKWLDNLKNDLGNPHYECLWPYAQALDEIGEMLMERETIVRCKDCKYAALTYQGELKYCKYFVDEYGFTNSGDPLYLEGDFFCAAGQRR